MDSKIYIIAVTFATITLVAGGWAEFPNGYLDRRGDSEFFNTFQFSANAEMRELENLVAYEPPLYKRPKKGSEVGGRAERNSGEPELVSLFALVPDHLGLTIDPQPTLFWYLSRPAPYPLILTLYAGHKEDPIMSETLGAFFQGGIHSVGLKDFGITLKLHTEYQWLVSLAIDPKRPANNIVAGGWIKRVVPGKNLLQKLRNAGSEDVSAIYSEEGLWYDALASIANLCEKSQHGNLFCVGQRDLLEQVDYSLDLGEIVKAEENISYPYRTESQ